MSMALLLFPVNVHGYITFPSQQPWLYYYSLTTAKAVLLFLDNSHGCIIIPWQQPWPHYCFLDNSHSCITIPWQQPWLYYNSLTTAMAVLLLIALILYSAILGSPPDSLSFTCYGFVRMLERFYISIIHRTPRRTITSLTCDLLV